MEIWVNPACSKCRADLPRDEAHRDEWLVAMAASPITIQRPIITADDGETVIARDDETLNKLLS
jgi:arsenate reductase (glutaredoxin)